MNLIAFEIGDWSGDGHNMSFEKKMWSNKTVEELREIHFLAPTVLGFDIGDICSKYEDNEVISDHLVPKVLKYLQLSDTGLKVYNDIIELLSKDSLDSINTDKPFIEFIEFAEDGLPVDEEELVILWCALLSCIDETAEFYPLAAYPVLDELGIELVKDALQWMPDNVTKIKMQHAIEFNTCKPDTMHFYGFDNQGRHLKVPGYGVFIS